MGKDLKMEAFASCEEVKPVILHVYELHAQNIEKNRFSIIRGAAVKLKNYNHVGVFEDGEHIYSRIRYLKIIRLFMKRHWRWSKNRLWEEMMEAERGHDRHAVVSSEKKWKGTKSVWLCPLNGLIIFFSFKFLIMYLHI